MIDKHFKLYTDLALEASEMVKEKEDIEIKGVIVDVDEDNNSDTKVTLVNVINDEGSKALHKPKGKYITIESGALSESDLDTHKYLAKLLCHNLEKLAYGESYSRGFEDIDDGIDERDDEKIEKSEIDINLSKVTNDLDIVDKYVSFKAPIYNEDKKLNTKLNNNNTNNREKDIDTDTDTDINSKFHNKKDNKMRNVLVVGLGNSNVTADSLGPFVAENIIVTRHLFNNNNKDYLDKSLFGTSSAIIPGVMGMTGMESSEIVKGVCEKIHPDVIIVVDSLAARCAERINKVIQITDTGIYPGSGVGNKRKILNKDTLGIKVIAIGVPTVVNALTLVSDICKLDVKEMNNKLSDEEIDDYMKYSSLCVTPKEEDIVIKRMKNVIVDGINMFIHKGLDIDDVKSYSY